MPTNSRRNTKNPALNAGKMDEEGERQGKYKEKLRAVTRSGERTLRSPMYGRCKGEKEQRSPMYGRYKKGKNAGFLQNNLHVCKKSSNFVPKLREYAATGAEGNGNMGAEGN